MRFPWDRREQQARQERINAEERLDQARADWAQVNAEVAVTRHERELNGWTATVETLFAGHRHRGKG
jgi:hypothetical protein